MSLRIGVRWQTALVVALFLLSLGILLFNNFSMFLLSPRKGRIRIVLAEAGRRLAEAAAPALAGLPIDREQTVSRELQQQLAAVAERTLADYPEVEGGFYLGGKLDQFVGFVFPTDQRPLPAPLPSRQDPPPLEAPYIRLQAQQSLHQPAGEAPLIQVRDVGPSRVAVGTAPVGSDRPARSAAWVMVRLIGPEQLLQKMNSIQGSTIVALGGIVLALLLTANLGRTLRQERLQRERLGEELRRSEHLAALGRLLAAVAHEVRNPLAAILSTVQLWERLPDQSRTPASLEAVSHAVGRLDALVSRLLYFARSSREERSPVDMNAIVREALELLRAQADAQGVALEANLAPDLPRVTGLQHALQQVVQNLTTNALQAMPQGGGLHYRTRTIDGGQRVELLVEDTGPGVSPECRARLFEPFFTTRKEGTGLGLALCREVIAQHDGQIELLPTPGPGAAFRVTLPVHQ